MGKRHKINEVKCKQCGRCCIVFNNGVWEDCKYLIRYLRGEGINEKRTRCLIYQHRLYAIIGRGQYCNKREKVPSNFPDCPFNKPNWKIHPNYIK